MKRIKNIWKNVIDIDSGIAAITKAVEFKRNNRKIQELLLYDPAVVAEDPGKWHMIDHKKLQAYASNLVSLLASRQWKHKKPRYKRQFCHNKTSGKGKWRDLYIPALDDHCVQHIVMRASMEVFTKGMHPYCCGSVPGRGIRHVLKSVSRWMQQDKECRYFVKLDIRHFFDSIDRDILKKILRGKIKDEGVLWIFNQIIDSAPVACPIGYYTSPWFANLYLEKLDWYISQQLYKERRGKRINYVRHYIRYVDDLLFIGTSKADLKKAIHAVQKYLHEELKLEIKPTWEIKQIGQHIEKDGKRLLKPGTYWCDICGYRFCKDSTTIRPGIFLATRRLARKIYKKQYATYRQCQSINARIGWASHCDSHRFLEHEIKPYVNIKNTRRLIRHVDKIRKRQQLDAFTGRVQRRDGHCQEELCACGSGSGEASALPV